MSDTLTIRLIGSPALVRDGVPSPPPRGAKAWALLAVLLTTDGPVSRQRLATLLFPQAQDPMAALRWNLSVLRRALGPGVELGGDPVTVALAPGDRVDVGLLGAGLDHRLDDEELLRLGGDLIEGVSVEAGPALESWLLVARLTVRAGCHALLHDAALQRLSTGNPMAAAALALRALELNPHDADDHALLVRSLLSAGEVDAAARHVERCRRTFVEDLGADLPDVVLRASRGRPAAPDAQPVAVSAVSAASYLEAGQASLGVGAVDTGEQQLRRAVEIARVVGDPDLSARALVTRAGGLLHGSGARGVEVAAMLHEGLAFAKAARNREVAAAVCRELAFLAVQLGHRARADAWLDEAGRFEAGDEERSRQLGIRGMSRTDAADYPEALDALAASIELATRTGAARQAAWSMSMVGRVHLLLGDADAAVPHLEGALEVLRETRWIAFLPWAHAWRAEAALDLGEVESAAGLLDRAWVWATEARDHCWMATVARGQARLASRRDDPAAALEWVRTGLRPSPWYVWPVAHLLDAGCALALESDPDLAREWADDLHRIAADAGLREHVVRSLLWRARLGDGAAAASTRSAAEGIENPALAALVSSAGGRRG